ncbi:phosphotransferase family protein [Streptomyces marincola]|uniref:phosphotransferase n=1 Tax=Streptomyces marincola TaxID=2878388 RepID=UPI001CF1EAA6|nr:phosphotransferase [Streptomyces marincola]UCM88500.1 phosphotransferase [Streptomyces marincola]
MSAVEPVARASGSDVAAVVDGEQGRFFVKAMRNEPGGRRDSIRREQVINPFVLPVSPAMLWSAEGDDWIALGFEYVEGRPADFSPGSADVARVVDALSRIGALDLPEVARGWTEDRWDWFTASDEEVALLRGESLIHGDIHPANFLLGDRRSWVVDWSWPTRGAAFIDPATLVSQLVSAGHRPADAEELVSGCPAWRHADPRGIDVFAAATLRMWREIAERQGNPGWAQEMVGSVASWAEYRRAHAG